MPFIDPAEVERVRQIDLLSYLQEREPDELVRTGVNTYRTKTHDSLKISNGKWYWWSQNIGGVSALDYLIKVRGISFLDAARHLGGSEISPPVNIIKKDTPKKEMALPPRAPSDDAAIAYLTSRGIEPHIIDHCIKQGLLYASVHKGHTNVVFIGKDDKGKARYACVRSITGDFKGEIAGSDKHYAFKLGDNELDSVHVFEGAIDVLSCATLMSAADMDWIHSNLLSLGGIHRQKDTPQQGVRELPRALEQYLADNPGTSRIHLHLDNDDAGRLAASTIAASIKARGIEVVNAPPPDGLKDMNDYLMAMRRRSKTRPQLTRTDRNQSRGRER